MALRPQAVRSAAAPTTAVAPPTTVVGRHPVALAGGLAALAALAALGLAGAARSSPWLAAGLEVVRSKPSFGLGHCPGLGVAHASGTAVVGSAAPPGTSPAAVDAGSTRGGSVPHAGGSSALPAVPHVGGILGTDISRGRPWDVVKVAVLAMLAAANVLLLAVRRRIARLEAP